MPAPAKLRLLLLTGALLAVGGPLAGRPAPAARRLLPDRELTCRIGHVINFDPGKVQTADQLRYDHVHDFALFLPSIPARTIPPPEPFEKPEPVDSRTRILADPDGIAPQADKGFERVVDYWPDRVELAAPIRKPQLNVIVIDDIDSATGTASLLMLRASELTRFDPAHVYQGRCSVRTGQPKGRAA